MENRMIHIDRWRTLKEDRESSLTKRQKWICDWFNIPEPPPRIFMEALIRIGETEDLKVRDFILIPDIHGDQDWIVIADYKPFYVISNGHALTKPFTYNGEAVIISHAFSEFDAGKGLPT